MMRLDEGTKIKLTDGREAVVDELLGSGGQGDVYRVLLSGNKYALKWYADSHINSELRRSLELKVEVGSPSAKLLWPICLTEEMHGSYGYVMELRPAGYEDLTRFLLAKTSFASHMTQVNAALGIVDSFDALHKKGFFFQNIVDSEFFINGKTGDVRIACYEDVVLDNSCSRPAFKARYMAPEVTARVSNPDMDSDLFSLAVVLFMVLFFDHPLEGERCISIPCLTTENEINLYGENPIFIYDRDDSSNRPVEGVHANAIRFWKEFPEFLKESFQKAFSREAMNVKDLDKARRSRLTCEDWRRILVNLRSCIIRCPYCGEEMFFDYAKGATCPNCKKAIEKTRILSFSDDGKYKVPIFPGVKIYKCMIDDSSNDTETVAGCISVNPYDSKIWGIKNECYDEADEPWLITLKDKVVVPGRSYPLGDVEKIRFGGKSFAKVID